MFPKIKITEYMYHFNIYAIDVPNGPTFLATNFFVFIYTFLKSLRAQYLIKLTIVIHVVVVVVVVVF